jgi:hypothetical protein
VALLDQADDAAAAALIEYAEPPSGYSLEQVQAFNLIRAELLAAFDTLDKKRPPAMVRLPLDIQ